MESYTFRCDNDDCGRYDSPITGITMQDVIADGGPMCGLCGDDLELIGADDGTEGDGDHVRKLGAIITSAATAIDALANEMPPPNEYTPRFMGIAISLRDSAARVVNEPNGADARDARRNQPTAYSPVPGPPVNPNL